MKLNDFNKIFVIISSKGHDVKKIYNILDKKLRQYLDEDKFSIYITESKYSIIEQSKEFAQINPSSLLIVLGGDGSINESINSIVGKDIYFGFLPLGTGNDFCRTVYPDKDIYDIIEGLNDIEIKEVDLIKVNKEYSINVMSFGFESIVLEKSLQLKKYLGRLNKLSVILGVLFTLNKIKPVKYQYKYKLKDGTYMTGQGSYIVNAICNGRYYGTGFLPAPYAKIDDGIIDLNICEYLGPIKLLRVLRKYKTPKHLELDISNRYEVISGSIKSLEGEIIGNIDGNIRHYTDIDFEILPKKIKLAIFKDTK